MGKNKIGHTMAWSTEATAANLNFLHTAETWTEFPREADTAQMITSS